MWVSLIIALLTYLLSPKDTKSQQKTALLSAAAAGAVTYGVTEYTDWGKENIQPLDNSISSFFNGTPNPAAATATGGAAQAQASSGLWDTLKSWGAKGVAAVIGTAGVVSGNSSLIWIAIAALIGIAVLH